MHTRRLVATLATIFLFALTAQAQDYHIENGMLDARSFDLSKGRLALSGTWNWYDNELLSPTDVPHVPAGIAAFPKTWNEIRVSKKGTGVATYFTRLLITRPAEALSVEIPQVYSSYTLWVNGQLLMKNGTVAETKELNIPQWLPQSATFTATSDTLDLVLQIANFHHHKGGIKDPIYLSTTQIITKRENLALLGYWIQFSILLLIALSFTIIYFFYGRKKIIIYFALLCFSWSIRTLFSNEYLSIKIFPDFSWSLMVKIEYLMLFFTMIWAILYLGRLFPKEGNQIIKYILVTTNSLFITFTILTPPVVFTRWLNLYLLASALLLIFGAMMVVKALINEQVGSGFLTFSTFLALLLFSYDIFTYEGLFAYNALLFSSGYIALFSMMGVALLMQLNIIKAKARQTTILTYADLYKDDTMMIK